MRTTTPSIKAQSHLSFQKRLRPKGSVLVPRATAERSETTATHKSTAAQTKTIKTPSKGGHHDPN